MYAPGFIVQVPEAGKPENSIVANAEAQFGCITLIVGVVGILFTVITTLSVLEQPLLSVPVNK